MLLSLLALSWLIVHETSGYKGPSKVYAEKYKRDAMQHPEMREVSPDEKLLIVNLSKVKDE